MGIYNYTQEEVFEGLAKASAEMPSGLGYVFHPSDDGLLSTRMIRSSSDGVSSVLSIARRNLRKDRRTSALRKARVGSHLIFRESLLSLPF